jgi:acid phosphatase type 7
MHRFIALTAAALLAGVLLASTLAFSSRSDVATTDPIIVGVGDIADDNSTKLGDNRTAQLIQTRWPEATVFANGDLAYETGTLTQFNTYYHDNSSTTAFAWGESLNDQIKPVPGNHEYGTSNADGYFAYFSQQGVPVGDGPANARGYYYYDLGANWRIFALNTGNQSVVPFSSTSAQYAWLEARLKEANAEGKNVMAYFHLPLYSSGFEHGWRNSTSTNKLPCSAPSVQAVKPLWNLLYRYGADLIVQAHDHSYERLVPITPEGATTDSNGAGTRPNPILSFVVGSGGNNLKPNGDKYPTDFNGDCGPLRPQSAKFLYDKFGVLALTLHTSSYDYQYVQTTNGTDAIIADSRVGVPVNP